MALHTSTELLYLKPDWYYDRWPFACIRYWYETSHPGKLSLLPSVGWEMSIGQSIMMLCGWGVKAGMTHSTCGLSVWVAGIRAPSVCVWYTHTHRCKNIQALPFAFTGRYVWGDDILMCLCVWQFLRTRRSCWASVRPSCRWNWPVGRWTVSGVDRPRTSRWLSTVNRRRRLATHSPRRSTRDSLTTSLR